MKTPLYHEITVQKPLKFGVCYCDKTLLMTDLIDTLIVLYIRLTSFQFSSYNGFTRSTRSLQYANQF